MSGPVMDDEEDGFDILSVSFSHKADRGPLQMITGERLARLQSIEVAAVRFVANPTPDNHDHLVELIRQKSIVEKS